VPAIKTSFQLFNHGLAFVLPAGWENTPREEQSSGQTRPQSPPSSWGHDPLQGAA
jgi:hypothetical protein